MTPIRNEKWMGSPMTNRLEKTPRRLTEDELKAAEAAFQGWEFNEAWSKAALGVYHGIRLAMIKVHHGRLLREVQNTQRHPLTGARLQDEVLV
jgi:hypothetical protein